MTKHPSFEDLEQAYREHSIRVDSVARGHIPQQMLFPSRTAERRNSMAPIWHASVAAAAVAAFILFVLPPASSLAISPHSDRKAAIHCINTTIRDI